MYNHKTPRFQEINSSNRGICNGVITLPDYSIEVAPALNGLGPGSPPLRLSPSKVFFRIVSGKKRFGKAFLKKYFAMVPIPNPSESTMGNQPKRKLSENSHCFNPVDLSWITKVMDHFMSTSLHRVAQ
ncbi:MAG: hypothetical protein JXR70_19565 [Spirochaetales bacterium]|nr:hypothetical protein [Spirochaetales bacterium]